MYPAEVRVEALLLLDQVLDVDVVLHEADLGLALVAVLVADLGELLLEDAPEHLPVGEQLIVVGDLLHELGVLGLQLLLLQALEPLELHVQDGLGLDLVQAEALHQALSGVVIALPDDADDLVDVVLGNEESFQEMRPLLRLAAVEDGAPGDDLLLEGNVLVQDLAQGEDLGLLLVVDESQHDDGKGGLHLGLGKEPVEHHLGIGVLLEFDDDAHALFAVRLVPQAGDPLQALVVDLVGDILHQARFVHLIGQLGHDDAGAVVAELLHLGAGADPDVTLAGGVGRPDAAAAHDDPPGGKIRALDVLHEVVQLGLGVIQHADGGVDDLPQVMGRDVGGHAHGDAGGAVHQEVGEAGGMTRGSFRDSSKLGSQSTVSFSMSRSISFAILAMRASV